MLYTYLLLFLFIIYFWGSTHNLVLAVYSCEIFSSKYTHSLLRQLMITIVFSFYLEIVYTKYSNKWWAHNLLFDYY